ncbi:MAG: DUF370 domain-containing protein [Oscillospiraceae bacterium]|nr:DUF370 domain-containing protein [Oscillospiraceae bacterium]
MYLHLGQSVVVPMRDIIGIFDLDNTSSSHITRAFLTRQEQEKRIVNISDDLPKSFVLCQKKGSAPVLYLSQLSSATLKGRAEEQLLE